MTSELNPHETSIMSYHQKLEAPFAQIADQLFQLICAELPDAERKIWHAHPVWFLDGNPIVGYSMQKKGLRLMFWSGSDFDEDFLHLVGSKFKDASVFFNALEDFPEEEVLKCLRKARNIQWDYKNIVKRKGKLLRLNQMILTEAQKKRMAALTFTEVYPHYLAKIERKGRNVDELHQVIGWLTGFSEKEITVLATSTITFETFFQKAKVNPNASLVTGLICGYRVEEIEDPLARLIRCLDKLVDELAKGKKMDAILRKPTSK